nr:hypothetical protein [Tanacetum cinerariifolium]
PRPTTGAVTPRLTATAKGKVHLTPQNERIGSKPGVPNVPSDDSEEEISWNSLKDEETDTHEQDTHDDEGDEKDNSDDEEGDDDAKNDDEDDDEETRDEESFDPIPRTPEDSVESIFAIASSLVAPLPTPTPTMTLSTITTITTVTQAPIPIAADLSEMELKKILIEKMVGNKSIQQSDEQRNLYKALVDAYEADKTILDSYGEAAILKRRPVQGSAQTWISELAKQAVSRSSFNELLDTPIDFSNFIMNRFRVDTLTPEVLAGPTYELMRGSCNSLTEL